MKQNSFKKLEILHGFGIEEPMSAEEQARTLEAFLRMQQIYNGAIREITTKLQILNEDMHLRQDHNPIHNIESRLKSPASIARKLRKKGLEISPACAVANLTDIAGIRVICPYLEDVYALADMLCSQDDLMVLQRLDYIAEPKATGYRSLHLVLMVPVYLSDHTERVPAEVQIRTIAMDFWASLEHELNYKGKANAPQDLKQELQQCAEEIAVMDQKMQDIHQRMKKLMQEE